jgi:hypothetical protein
LSTGNFWEFFPSENFFAKKFSENLVKIAGMKLSDNLTDTREVVR